MVLYYKKVKKVVDPEPNDNKSEENSKAYDLPDITTARHQLSTRASNQGLFDEIYKTMFSGRKELYYSLLEDNFNNLSLDDKLVVIYKTYVVRSNITNNYILMCLAILVIIAFKLYSK